MRNLLTGRTVTVSPAHSQDLPGSLLNGSEWDTRSSRILTDGAIYSLDHFANNQQWALWDQSENATVAITIDLGAATQCALFRAYGGHNFGANTGRPKAITFESSDDGSSWTTVDNLTGLTSPGTGSGTRGWVYEADLSSAGSHRYWKLTLTHKSQYISLTEIELFDVGDEYTNLFVADFNLTDPGVDDDHYLRIRTRTDAGTGFIRVRLFQDTTLIGGFEFEPIGTFEVYEYELTSGEAAAITDYTDLQLHIDVKATSTPFTPEIDYALIAIPELAQGQGAASIVVATAATGKPTHKATGASTITVTTSGSGKPTHKGQGAASIVVNTSATGEPTHEAAGSSSIVVSVSGTGRATHFATGSSSVVVLTSATGQVTHEATGSSSVVVTISATGEATHFATGASSIVVTTSGTGFGTGLGEGAGSASVVVTTNATGRGTHFRTGASNVVVTTTGTGRRAAKGQGSANIVVIVAGTGKPTHKGSGSASVVVTTSGVGLSVGLNEGSGTASIVITTTATGRATHFRTGAANVAVTVTAAGERTAQRSGAVNVVVTTTADGQRTAKRSGTANVVVTTSGAGIGQAVHQGSGATSIVLTASAAGERIVHGQLRRIDGHLVTSGQGSRLSMNGRIDGRSRISVGRQEGDFE